MVRVATLGVVCLFVVCADAGTLRWGVRLSPSGSTVMVSNTQQTRPAAATLPAAPILARPGTASSWLTTGVLGRYGSSFLWGFSFGPGRNW